MQSKIIAFGNLQSQQQEQGRISKQNFFSQEQRFKLYHGFSPPRTLRLGLRSFGHRNYVQQSSPLQLLNVRQVDGDQIIDFNSKNRTRQLSLANGVKEAKFGLDQLKELRLRQRKFFQRRQLVNSSPNLIKQNHDVLRQSIDVSSKPIGVSSPRHKNEEVRDPEEHKRWLPKIKRKVKKVQPKVEENPIQLFNEKMLQSYGIQMNDKKTYVTYFVGPGNNDNLISQLLRQRLIWKRVNSIEQANFVWTQVKKSKILNKLKSARQFDFQFFNPGTQKNFINGEYLISEAQQFKLARNFINFNGEQIKIYNRLQNNQVLCSKRHLLKNMKVYYIEQGLDPFQFLPLSFCIKSGLSDPEFNRFLAVNQECQSIWIIKPGEATNCGKGIKVEKDIEAIQKIIMKRKTGRTSIIQKYIENPLLIYSRKFDIRCYAMFSNYNGILRGYFYLDGYLRTTSNNYNTKNLQNPYIHLTNDAIQKKSPKYGKFEGGNKLSYTQFNSYLKQLNNNIDFFIDILPQIRRIVIDTFQAAGQKIDTQRKQLCFEILGYDFMIDENFKPWLIEVNTNPCLSLSSSYLAVLIPAMTAFGSNFSKSKQ